jgi:hypothetical protein
VGPKLAGQVQAGSAIASLPESLEAAQPAAETTARASTSSAITIRIGQLYAPGHARTRRRLPAHRAREKSASSRPGDGARWLKPGKQWDELAEGRLHGRLDALSRPGRDDCALGGRRSARLLKTERAAIHFA